MELRLVKVADAQARNEAWRHLNTLEKIAALDRRLGKGVGAKKQRAKLAALLYAEQEKRKLTPKRNDQR